MRLLFRLLSAAFAAVAAYHAVLAARGEGDVLRHLVFVGIDGVVAGLLLARPPGTALVLAVLTGQQLVSHGGDLLRTWRALHRIDLGDVAVLVVLPLALVAAVIDARRARLR